MNKNNTNKYVGRNNSSSFDIFLRVEIHDTIINEILSRKISWSYYRQRY